MLRYLRQSRQLYSTQTESGVQDYDICTEIINFPGNHLYTILPPRTKMDLGTPDDIGTLFQLSEMTSAFIRHRHRSRRPRSCVRFRPQWRRKARTIPSSTGIRVSDHATSEPQSGDRSGEPACSVLGLQRSYIALFGSGGARKSGEFFFFGLGERRGMRHAP